jgi:hypothetical protein
MQLSDMVDELPSDCSGGFLLETNKMGHFSETIDYHPYRSATF